MKIHPKSFTVEQDKGIQMDIIGTSTPMYIGPQKFEVSAVLNDPKEMDKISDLCFNNKKEDITICGNKQEYYIENALITSFDVNIGANNSMTEMTVEFVSTPPDTVTFDMVDRSNVTMPRSSYNTFVEHYGKPESMMYEDFYDKYVAVEI